MPVLLNYPLFHADDDEGAPLTGGLLYSYIAGTSTEKATYTTRAMGTANANPVVLNSRGEAVIYGSGLYKLILKTSAGVTIWTQDNVELGPGQGAYSFFVNPAETDQGAAGSGASLYDILTALGTSKKATVYLSHSGTADTTSYTVSTTFDASAYTNVTFEPENGAILSVGTGITLTLPSPASIVASPSQQIFSGAGTVAFGAVGEIMPGWYGLSTSASGANNATYFGQVITGMTAGSEVVIPPGSYTIAGNLTVSKACKLEGYKATFTWASDTTASRGLLVTASNVEIYGIKLDGPQHASSVSTQKGIYAYGADSSNYISGLKIKDCEITDWGFYGIHLKYVEDFEIENNWIHALYDTGIGMESCQDGKVIRNTVEDIDTVVGGGKYGIFASRVEDDSVVTEPRSTRIVISENIVKDISTWEGIDTHGGTNCVISNNIVTGCLIGISLSPSDNSSNEQTFAPKDTQIIGNTINSGVTDGTYNKGINIAGAYHAAVIELASGIVVQGNTIRGHGDDSEASDNGGIFARTTQGLVISGNQIIEASRHGIYLGHSNRAFSITGNTIIDPWSGTAGGGMGIRVYGDVVTHGVIGGNSLSKLDKVATSVLAVAIRVDNNTDTYALIGKNWTLGAGIYLTDEAGRGFKGIFSDTSTSGTGEDDLKSFVIPQYMIAQNNKVLVKAAGKNTGAAGNKTVKFYLGATAWTVIPAANNENEWKVNVEITQTGTATQRISMLGMSGTSIVYQDYSAGAVDIHAADVTVKFTGECANAGDTITQYTLDIEVL